MRSRRYNIRQMDQAVGAVANFRDLVIVRMPTSANRCDSRHDLGVRLYRFELPIGHRDDFLGRLVCGVQALVSRILRDLEFALLHKNPRLRKGRLESARLTTPHDSAAMIEMQMR